MARSYSLQTVCKHCAALFLCFSFVNSLHFKILNKKITNQARSRVKREADDVEFGKNYLVNYGYVPPGSLHDEQNGTAQLRSWRKALTSMQSFMGIEPSGNLDDVTLEMMRRPRCGNPDKDSVSANLKRKRRYVKVDAKWRKSTITYSINNFTPKLGKKLTHEAIDGAFAVWARHSPLRFKRVSIHENPDIVTYFAEGFHNDNTPFDGPGGFLAHAYYPGSGIGGDTHFDGAEEWTLHEKAYEGTDLFLVAVHELGHALGLGHSSDISAIMAPVYRYHKTRRFKLPQDDINGIQSIYGTPGSRPRPPITPRTTRRPPVTTPPTTTRKPTTTTHKFVPTISRRPRRTTTPSPPPTSRTTTTKPPPPDLCSLKRYDAVSFLRQEFYVFSGEYLWRRLRNSDVIQGPFQIASYWPRIRKGVNAVYENPAKNNIVFFKDHLYYEYDGLSLKRSPRPVRFYGLQNEHVGAAVYWERNGKTYLFQGSYYWRINGTRAEKDYPKHIRNWYGVPANIDAAFAGVGADSFNHTYFVKGTQYYKFDNWRVEVIGRPRSFKEDWLGCPPDEEETHDSVEKAHQVSFTRSPAFVIGMSVGTGALMVVVIVIIVRFRRPKQLKTSLSAVVITSNPHYGPGSVPSEEKQFLEPKTTYVSTTAHQKWRWLKFSFQKRV